MSLASFGDVFSMFSCMEIYGLRDGDQVDGLLPAAKWTPGPFETNLIAANPTRRAGPIWAIVDFLALRGELVVAALQGHGGGCDGDCGVVVGRAAVDAVGTLCGYVISGVVCAHVVVLRCHVALARALTR